MKVLIKNIPEQTLQGSGMREKGNQFSAAVLKRSKQITTMLIVAG